VQKSVPTLESVPTLLIDPAVLFREGLRRILVEAGFPLLWCDGHPPAGQLPDLPEQSAPLLIFGGEIEAAMAQVSVAKRIYPSALVVLISEGVVPSQLVAALRGGVNAVLLKRSSCEGLIGSLKLVLSGWTVLPAELVSGLVAATPAAQPLPTERPAPELKLSPMHAMQFSAREKAVLHQLSYGLSNKEIARELNITEATVKVHVKAVLRKSKTRNRTQVATLASRQMFWGSSAEHHSPPPAE
jgi:two-component system nitrate/nitrite response regulator NarL